MRGKNLLDFLYLLDYIAMHTECLTQGKAQVQGLRISHLGELKTLVKETRYKFVTSWYIPDVV